jgi:hypothetical protein
MGWGVVVERARELEALRNVHLAHDLPLVAEPDGVSAS